MNQKRDALISILNTNISILNYIPMKEDDDSLTPEEKLQQENNLLKLKLMAEHQAQFPEQDENPLNPEQENAWLNYIYNFEALHKNAKKISVYERIGRPEFQREEDLNDEMIEKELDRLYEVMHQHSVVLDCCCEYEARVIYKFITEELFEYEIEDLDVKIEGMFTHFIYEEFYPNHDDDLRRYTHEFLEALLERKWNKYDEHVLCRHILDKEGEISEEVLIERIKLFQQAWESFKVTTREILNVQFDEEKGEAKVDVSLKYDAIKKQNVTVFNGKASIYFEQQYGYWCIRKIAIPGFNTPG
ncbi:hypothetical protein C900_03937 [Fulvivirga imtechensis AK7]|uniref:Uncharacterized protein n=1 Tax=Fulvivirga imtechensis AK7 TaxID=1237149 RepID=L8JSC5_9BACT|nr:hypothetical protein [Fulvivirga imtechensis]ELR70252.1 hypothetical protein C900_03937 [Fulvivirga imtechensis AK7]